MNKLTSPKTREVATVTAGASVPAGSSRWRVRRSLGPDGRVAVIGVSCALLAAILGWAVASGNFVLLVLVPAVLAIAGFSMFESVPMPLLLGWLAFGPILIPFARFPGGGSALLTFDRLMLLGLGVTAFSVLVDGSRVSKRTRSFAVWLGALTGLVLLRALLGTAGETQGLKVLLDAFLVPAIVFAVVRAAATSQKRIDQMLFAFGLGGALASVVVLAQRLIGFSLAARSGGLERLDMEADIVRYSGPYAVPEVFTVVALCSLAATLCWGRRAPGRTWIAGPMVGILLIGLYLPFFRTGWAAALLIVVGSFVWGKSRNQRAVVGGLVAMGLVVVGVGQFSQGQTAVSTRLSNSANTYGRIAAYQQGLQMIQSNPVLGVGLGGYPVVSRRMAPTWFGGRQNVYHPHNSLIQIGAEAGLFALLAAIGLGVACVRILTGLWRRGSGWLDDRLAVCGALTFAAYILFGIPFSLLPYGAATSAVFVILGLCSARLDALTSE